MTSQLPVLDLAVADTVGLLVVAGAALAILLWGLVQRLRPYRLPLVHVWRTLYQLDPLVASRVRLRRTGKLTTRKGTVLFGCAFDDGTAEVYLDGRPQLGAVLVTALHEWAHVIRGSNRHDRRFETTLADLLYASGVPLQRLYQGQGRDEYEAEAEAYFTALPVAQITVRWRRGQPGGSVIRENEGETRSRERGVI